MTAEKLKPTYALKIIKKLVKNEDWAATATAIKTAHTLNVTRYEIQQILLSLESSDFYKSMTSHYNHKEWQDVYIKTVKTKTSDEEFEDVKLYIKFLVKDSSIVLVLSFKEK